MPGHLLLPERLAPIVLRVAVPVAGSITRMSAAVYGAQLSFPSGPGAMPGHLLLPERLAPIVVRVAVPVAGSITRMSVALYGTQYSFPSGPSATPDHFTLSERSTPMFVRCAVAIHVTPQWPQATGANAASPSATSARW